MRYDTMEKTFLIMVHQKNTLNYIWCIAPYAAPLEHPIFFLQKNAILGAFRFLGQSGQQVSINNSFHCGLTNILSLPKAQLIFSVKIFEGVNLLNGQLHFRSKIARSIFLTAMRLEGAR